MPDGETFAERTEVNRYWFFLLFDANRWAVTVGLAVAVFLAFMLFGVLKPVPLHTTLQKSNLVARMFAGLIGAIITGTSLVVTINQLVLSQEIGSFGKQRRRMDSAFDVRETTDELLGMTTPVDPATYLGELISTTERRATTLREALSGADHGTLHEEVDAVVNDLLTNAEQARDDLDGAEFGTFDVVSAMLDYNYDRKIHDVRRLGMEHEADLTSDERDAFRDLLEAITMYGVVREYVKNLYIQWELMKLSRALLYAAVVALVVSGGMVVFVDPTTFPGEFLGTDTMLWVVSAAFAVSTFPFLLFTAYILRLATLAKRTLSVGPLILN